MSSVADEARTGAIPGQNGPGQNGPGQNVPRQDGARARTADRTDDPVDELVARLGDALGRPVDAFQVAAVLESDGITDRSARVEYGYADVFALAGQVYGRLSPAPRRVEPTSVTPAPALRDISHGALYLLPSALLPLVLAGLGRHGLIATLVTVSALGWVWSAGVAWLAWRLLGRGLIRSAGRTLRLAGILGVPLAALVTLPLIWRTGGSMGLVALAAGQMAYQMSVTAALFYRREGVLLCALAPGAVVGAFGLAVGRSAAPAVVVTALGSVAVASVLALRWTTASRHPAVPESFTAAQEPTLIASVRAEVPHLAGVVLYAALCAAFLLSADARFAGRRLDLAIAGAPLIAGMGLVEWQARRFQEYARDLLHRVRYPRVFVVRVWWRLLGGLAAVMALVTALAAPLLFGLYLDHLLSTATVLLAAAHVAVGGAYYLAFLLASHDAYVLAGLALITAGAVRLAIGGSTPLAQAAVFLAGGLLLQVLLCVALLAVVGQVRRYR